MSINNPIALAFAAVLPAIIALYLLRLKRKKYIVASTFFWTEAIQDLQANVPFQRLRWNILLFLQLLIAAAIIAGMLDLGVRAALNEGRRTIFVVDTSASMLSREGGETRFQQAIGDLRTYCTRLSKREQVMIIDAGEHARLVLNFTENQAAIERALDDLSPRDTRSDLATAYALAQSRASEVDKPHIVVVSDFSGVEPDIFLNAPYPVSFLQVGRGGRNVAIIDFTVTGVSLTDEGTEVSPFIAVRNYTDDPVECDVEFSVDGKLVDVRSISAKPGSRASNLYRSVPYPVESDAPGVLEARLDLEDDLPMDNIAYALPPGGEGMSVLIAGEDPFLTLALAGIPGIRLYQLSKDDFAPGAGYDLTVFPGWAPEDLPAGNYVFFDPPDRDYLPCSMDGQVDAPHVTDWDDGHPILRFVNPGSFNVFVATKAQPKPGSVTLVDGDVTPLLVYGERNYLRALVFPFHLTSSDLITRPAFPILAYNIISFFRSYSETGMRGLRTEGISAITVDALGDSVRVSGPEEFEMEFPIDAGHAFVDVDRIGVYTMQVPEGEEERSAVLVANFFDEVESDIGSAKPPEIGEGAGELKRFEVKGEKRLWKWLAVFALIVLTGEWFFYHRKGF